MKMLNTLLQQCSKRVHLALVKADLIPQLITTLNPHSLSFAEAEDIHINLLKPTTHSLWLATPDGLTELRIKDGNEQQAVHETPESSTYLLIINRQGISFFICQS
ncbi:hypothetical protein BLNAU_9908 [Blattamonas nauphoetae]|uniref:Uncharacterized protein n=1 Tax=Blattamonas nauphoetae TaxID=2049346 RepID=A0ABQ9XUM5_9EUKA|nr:hypothetical protein BLNAU_9908 [Blattamonas nauphoetae]